MAANVNWVRWIKASIAVHMNSYLLTSPMFVEGQLRNNQTGIGQPGDSDNKFEVRIDGPDLRESTHDHFGGIVEVNILAQAVITDDAYMLERLLGEALRAMTTRIQIFKYGDGVDDDQTLLVCISRMDQRFHELTVNNFGQIEPQTRLQQGAVEAHYRVELIGG